MTTQRYARLLASNNVYHRFKTLTNQRQYRQVGGYLGTYLSDAFKFKIKLPRANQCAQLFTNRADFTYAVPLPVKSEANNALYKFIHHIGVTSEILTDVAQELHKSD